MQKWINQLYMVQGCPQDSELFVLKTEIIFKKTVKVSSCSTYNVTFIMEMTSGNKKCSWEKDLSQL